ncbi:hypothetical protein SGL43_00408 [Streptomyces globisporus]|uniref:Uncharacterized protein n=1 Tax=Streptomyces globisporus TaxID=1908 RepID=A0ABM9GRV5_STRGL|nr:hypothetical protein SGL43_00408 [Streptomyces globisporus]
MPVLGWEKCYVLGKESARIGDVSRIRSTGVHPRATTTGRAVRTAGRTGPACGREPPCPRSAPLPPTHPVGTQQTLGHRLETGLKVLDRAWPIVVHSRP